MLNLTFDQCVRRIQNGDQSGLKEIYEHYHTYIYGLMLSVVKNKENAEDLTADFFIKLWKLADQYQMGSGHKAWLTVMARNMAIDFLRKSGREQLEQPEEMYDSGHQESAEDVVLEKLSFSEMVAQLPNDGRQIMTMKFAAQMTFKEIAAALDMPIGTVTWKYQKCMEQLRRAGI